METSSDCPHNEEITNHDSCEQDGNFQKIKPNVCSPDFSLPQCSKSKISQKSSPCDQSTSSALTFSRIWSFKWCHNEGMNKVLFWLLSFCFPIDNAPFSCSGSFQPFMLCVPSDPSVTKPKEPKEKKRLKPIGIITRNKDADFIGGKFVGGCTCGMKNGLSGNCPRISCQNNPGCLMNPPQCWPQFKEPEPPPPPPPDQKMICVPIQLVYYDPAENKFKKS